MLILRAWVTLAAMNTKRVFAPSGSPGIASGLKKPGRNLAIVCGVALCSFFPVSTVQAESTSSGSWLDGLTVFGSVRVRPEFRGNPDFNRKTDDTGEFVGSRIQLGFEKYISEETRIVIRMQDSRVWGGTPGSDTGFGTASDQSGESLDLREGYLRSDNLLGPLGITVGRQMLDYGSGRQIGALGWSNVGRSFDALELHWNLGIWKASLAAAVLAEEDGDGGGNSTQVGRSNPSGIEFQCNPSTNQCTVTANTPRELDDAYLAVLYNEIRIHPQFQVEPYYIGVFKKWIPASTSAVPGLPVAPKERSRQRDNLHTVGLRITNKTVDGKSASPMFDYSVEGAFQFGLNGQRVQAGWDLLDQRDPAGNPVHTQRQRYEAHAVYADLGFKPVDFLRIGVMGDLATGDPDRTDAVVSTYTQLYPTNHAPMGDMDLIGSRNLIARAISFTFDFKEYGSMKLAYWHYRKHKDQDSFYGNGGAVARDANGELLSTETRSNSRYSSVLDTSGKISENSVAQLSSQLFHEYNFTYGISVRSLKISLGYGQAYALSSIRHRVDDAFDGLALQERAFDPRSDFAYFMISGTF
ncbi:MAG: hypothetical protein CMN76_18815 [Spirochaetaceae bacterium]|nr:hypothetical protein [Spirochaetaceae bacterium]